MTFSEAHIPDLSGKTAVITGATGGLGFEMARMLAAVHARVIIAGRGAAKGDQTIARIRAITPDAHLVFEQVEMGSLSSIEQLSARLLAKGEPIDVLINNAGIMAPPERKVTEDGFEVQIGVNHLGHYALTGRLLPLLRAAKAPRVVSIASGAAKGGKINFDDLQSEKKYRPIPAYRQSKMANLLFMRQLQTLSDQRGWHLLSVAAHPGFARTDLINNGPGELRGLLKLLAAFYMAFSSHDAAGGALPAVLAVTGPDVAPFDYYGPTRMNEAKGPPGKARLPAGADDDAVAERLWDVSERLTGVIYPR